MKYAIVYLGLDGMALCHNFRACDVILFDTEEQATHAEYGLLWWKDLNENDPYFIVQIDPEKIQQKR